VEFAEDAGGLTAMDDRWTESMASPTELGTRDFEVTWEQRPGSGWGCCIQQQVVQSRPSIADSSGASIGGINIHWPAVLVIRYIY